MLPLCPGCGCSQPGQWWGRRVAWGPVLSLVQRSPRETLARAVKTAGAPGLCCLILVMKHSTRSEDSLQQSPTPWAAGEVHGVGGRRASGADQSGQGWSHTLRGSVHRESKGTSVLPECHCGPVSECERVLVGSSAWSLAGPGLRRWPGAAGMTDAPVSALHLDRHESAPVSTSTAFQEIKRHRED